MILLANVRNLLRVKVLSYLIADFSCTRFDGSSHLKFLLQQDARDSGIY